jgi:hypothetical protein
MNLKTIQKIDNILDDNDLNYLLNHPETLSFKNKILSRQNGSEYFNIDITPEISQKLLQHFNLSLSKVPMRWIKGDISPHKDVGAHNFQKTHLIYLTDSQGNLVIENDIYPISKNTGYIFSEGLQHETIDTGLESRLLLGPMSEEGLSVGAATTIYADGATETIYFKYTMGSGITYKINDGSYLGFSLPVTILNTNPSFTLKVLFENNLTLQANIFYFICGSANIQFGSESLNVDGLKTIITIDNVSDYPGFIRNGTNGGNGFNNIYVYNLEVNSINGSTLITDGGWIGQSYFGNQAQNNFIINCSSNGPIIDGGGGIVGGYAGQGDNVNENSSSLYIIGCSSSGASATYSGGIVGFFAGRNGGSVVCQSCWSTGSIGPQSGGIFGYQAANGDSYPGFVKAIKCYSLGNISGNDAGGIFGQLAGTSAQTVAEACYSQGTIGTNAGGIYGSGAATDGGTTYATNCYSWGTVTLGNGIYSGGTGTISGPRYENNCYAANNNWSDATAKSQLMGTPNPVVGTTWVATSPDYPYELNNMGYTPYTTTNIVFEGVGETPILKQSYTQTISAGGLSKEANREGYSYDILKISGGDPSSYGTITMNDNTGKISTTSSTAPGTYTIVLRNTGSYNITQFILNVSLSPPPFTPTYNLPNQARRIRFGAGTGNSAGFMATNNNGS